MMISCKKAAELMSQELDGNLNRWQRFTLNFHLLLCSGCDIVRRQFHWLQRVARLADDESGGAPRLLDENCELSPQAAERIKKLIEGQNPGVPPAS